MRNPAKLTAALTRLDWAASDAWDALSPAQQRALRRAMDDDELYVVSPRGHRGVRVRTDTNPRTRQALEDAGLLEPTKRRAKRKSCWLTPAGRIVRAADPELGKRPR